MSDDELDDVRTRKIQERFAEAQKAKEIEMQTKQVLRQLTEPSAYERMMNVKMSNPSLYQQVVVLIARMRQSGQLKGKLTEEQLVKLLSLVIGSRKEGEIEIKRK